MDTHVMHDIETLGTRPGSVILSIGAVRFCPITQTVSDEFYVNIDRHVSMLGGLTTDQSTVEWWKRQRPEAWEALEVDPVNPAIAFQRYADWCRGLNGAMGDLMVWSHGATFDTPLLEVAFRAFNISPPWKFWNARCTRTIYDLAGNEPDRSKGTHHNALDDARNQAEAVLASYRKLGLAKEHA